MTVKNFGAKLFVDANFEAKKLVLWDGLHHSLAPAECPVSTQVWAAKVQAELSVHGRPSFTETQDSPEGNNPSSLNGKYTSWWIICLLGPSIAPKQDPGPKHHHPKMVKMALGFPPFPTHCKFLTVWEWVWIRLVLEHSLRTGKSDLC